MIPQEKAESAATLSTTGSIYRQYETDVMVWIEDIVFIYALFHSAQPKTDTKHINYLKKYT